MNGFDLSTITGIYVGSVQYSAIYYGSTRIWPIGELPVHNYSQDYLTIVSLENNNTISWNNNWPAAERTISISTDNGLTWVQKTSDMGGTALATLNNGNKLLIKGTNSEYAYWGGDEFNHNYFSSTGDFNIEGNIMSLFYGDNFIGQITLPDGGIGGGQGLLYGLFQSCENLVSAENLKLPATILTIWCYAKMFIGCTSLTTAPELPATILTQGCYEFMFGNCSSLNYIKCLATDISASDCTYYWVDGVSATGTFIKDPNTTSWTTGVSGIPTGWTLDNNQISYDEEYFTVEPLANGTITFNLSGLSYSTDQVNWTSLGTSALSVTLGQKVYLKGTMTPSSSTGIGTLSATSNINVSGNIMSLIYGDNFIGQTSLSGKNYAFSRLFYNNTYVVNAQNLILSATTLVIGCYYMMFMGCTSLTSTPILPATTLATGCYANMFEDCKSLTTAPELPATTLAISCCEFMFYGCTSLTTTPATLSATILANQCYQAMFSGCTLLATAPELPATALADGCYANMFNGCTSLTTAPELFATTLVYNCYNNMFYNCTSLNYIKCLATDITASSCTSGWTYNVAATGTFVKDKNMSGWTVGANGIPTNWTTIDDGVVIFWSTNSYNYTLNTTFTAPTLNNPNNLTVTYTSSDTSVATINNSTGAITTLSAGTTTISAIFAGNGEFEAQTASYTLVISKANANISWGNSTYSYNIASLDKPVFNNPNNLTVTFSSSDTNVATIDSSGNVTYVDDGTCILTATFSGNSTYNASTVTCTLALSSQPDYSSNYFTIESEANNNTITWKSSSSSNTKSISVSADNGTTWTSYTSDTTGVTIGTLNQGGKLLLKGSNKRYGTSQGARNMILGSANFKVYGNILSLSYDDNFASQTTLKDGESNVFVGMFRDSTHLTDAENLKLPATVVTSRSYMDMFKDCTSLVTPPLLPATTVGKYAYEEMFRGCTSMTSVPNLPAQSLTEHCYDAMFRECSSITTPPTMSATSLDEYCCCDMFRDCPYLLAAPDLLAPTLTLACYSQMFEGCIRLKRVRCLATDISASDCTTNWLRYASDSGTFIKSSSNTSWSSDASGIPSGWTVTT